MTPAAWWQFYHAGFGCAGYRTGNFLVNICRAGSPQAAAILGADYDGWLTHDGWKVYSKFLELAIRAASPICFAAAKT